MSDDKVRINGNLYDFGSTSLRLADEPIYGYVSVSWAQKRERQKGYGAGKDRLPQGRTRGRMAYENLKIKVRRDTASAIKTQLAARAADGQSYGDADDVLAVLQYVEEESNQEPVLVEFADCAYVGESNVSEEEGGPDYVEIELDYQRLDETINGTKVTLYSSGS